MIGRQPIRQRPVPPPGLEFSLTSWVTLNNAANSLMMGNSAVGVLLVQLDTSRIGLPTAVVRYVVRAAAMAPLPKAPAIIEGVLNVRGRLVPVLDIRQRFGLPEVPLHPDQHYVIAEAGPRWVALRVDRALDVVKVAPELFEPAERAVPSAQYVAALARLPDGVLVIHDLDGFLSLDEANGLAEALACRSGAADAPAEESA